MASLDEAFSPLLENNNKKTLKKTLKKEWKKISTICPNCKTDGNVWITNDFNKSCGCTKCSHIFWKHGVTPECNCGECYQKYLAMNK